MTLPGQTFSFPDGGLGSTGQLENVPLYIGHFGGSTPDNTVVSIGSSAAAIEKLVSGPVFEDLTYQMARASGRGLAIRPARSVAQVIGAVAPARTSTSTGTIAVTGTVADDYEIAVKVTKTGALGVARFVYSLDGGITVSPELDIPLGGAFAPERTGLTLTFTAGAGPIIFEAGDSFTLATSAAYFNATDLSAAIDAAVASGSYFSHIVLSGAPVTPAAGAVLFSALDSKLASMTNALKPVAAIMHVGRGTPAEIKTAFAGLTSRRIAKCSDLVRLQSGNGYMGLGQPWAPTSRVVAMRAVGIRFSRDLAKNEGDGATGGPIPGATALSRDENDSPELDEFKCATLRTVPGLDGTGYYLTNAPLSSPVGSDYRYWQHIRIVNEVHRLVAKEQAKLSGADLRVKADGSGTIDDADADVIEERIQNLIDSKFLRGSLTDASAIKYAIDRTQDLLATETVVSSTDIVPKAVVKHFSSAIRFTKRINTRI